MTAQSTVSGLIRLGESKLRETSETPYLDSLILFCFLSGFSRVQCVTHSSELVTEELKNKFYSLIERRIAREPIAYITGEKEFWSLSFKASPAVLIPRPETELLVEEALKVARSLDKEPCIVDIGTGSGCIAIAVAHELKKEGRTAKIIATDISSDALSVAVENAKAHYVEGMINFRQGSLFDPLEGLAGAIDLIISNPPYIESGDPRVDPGTVFEPQNALYADGKGLGIIEDIIEKAPLFHTQQGITLIEFGAGQEVAIEAIVNRHLGNKVRFEFLKDHAGLYRAIKIVATT